MTPARIGTTFLALAAVSWLASCGRSTPAGENHAPAAPQGVSATGANGQITVQWSEVPGASSYNLYWSTAPGVTTTNGTRVSGVTSPYVHVGRTNGVPSYYVVTAVSGAGEGPASSEVTATPAMSVGVWDGSTWDSVVWGT